MDYPTKEKPTGLVPFDTDNHLNLAAKYAASVEAGMFRMNQIVCNQNAKAHGMRIGFDIVQVKSLVHPERSSVFITLEPTYCGKSIPMEISSNEIAGVMDDELWFEHRSAFYPASFELAMRKEMHQKLASPLKDAFQNLEQTLRDLQKDQDPGEDWKDPE